MFKCLGIFKKVFDIHMIFKNFIICKYEVINKGHFGLAFNNYCHFTSPIRRFPDLIVHYSIRALLEKSSISFNGNPSGYNNCCYWNNSIKWRSGGIQYEVRGV